MGFGDQLIATGIARGASARGKRIAFGDGRRIYWDAISPIIFRHNPNIAPPGQERAGDLEWINYRKGHRQYQRHDAFNNRWVWNMDFRVQPGEVFFDEYEIDFAKVQGIGFIVIEPDVPMKMHAINKRWPIARYQQVAEHFRAKGVEVVRFKHGKEQIPFPLARSIETPSFRHALACLRQAMLYIGPEGGLHHGAAAVGLRAVVLFGGFIPPQVTGYDTHINLTGGATEFCGKLKSCPHCRQAMQAITTEQVIEAARSLL